MLLLLGTRSGETLLATLDEFDSDNPKGATWTIPVEHQKLTGKQMSDARPWVVPLPPMAVELVRELMVFAKSLGSNHLASSFARKGRPLTSKALVHAMRGLYDGEKPLLVSARAERPTPHYLRRTFRTNLGERFNVPNEIAERCLNHRNGPYNHGDYIVQRREALEKWAAYIERLLSGKKATVAFLPGKTKKARR